MSDLDLIPETQARPRGRTVPQPTPKLIDIIVNEVTLATVDVSALTAGAQFDLEDAKTARQLLAWLETHAAVDDIAAVEATLRPMKVQAIVDLLNEIATTIGRATSVPKARARR